MLSMHVELPSFHLKCFYGSTRYHISYERQLCDDSRL